MHVRCWDVIVPSSIAVSTSCSDALRRSRELSPFIFISPVITRNEIGINASMEIPGHGQQLYSSVTVLHQKRAYTHSGNSGSKCVHQNLLLTVHAYMHFVYAFSLISIQNAYMHEETTIGFGVRIWGRKYLNECTPFSVVRQ